MGFIVWEHRPAIYQLAISIMAKKTPEEVQAEYEEELRQEKLRVMEIVESCMRPILAGTSPATIDNADDMLATEEFISSVESHTGQSIPIAIMFEWLTNEGYIFARLGNGTQLKWLLKRNNQ